MVSSVSTTPLPRYHNPTWKLLSQGAEARVWFIPSFLSSSSSSSPPTTPTPTSTSTTIDAICKERFPKLYRHPSLNDSLTRARTKAETKCLVRCRRAGVSVPLVLGVDVQRRLDSTGGGGGGKETTNETNGMVDKGESRSGSGTSALLFLEHIKGCTVREFLSLPTKVMMEVTNHNNNDEEDGAAAGDDNDGAAAGDGAANDNTKSPVLKKPRVIIPSSSSSSSSSNTTTNNNNKHTIKIETRLDQTAIHVAYAIGSTVAKMHNAGVVHGDLTTSNLMLRNPPPTSTTDDDDSSSSSISNDPSNPNHQWKPDIVVIDFGLSRTDTGIHNNKKQGVGTTGSNGGSSKEELAVDLYVLERAFATTHVGSEILVDELFRAYKAECSCSDAVLVRLAEVRLRGRKRECFG